MKKGLFIIIGLFLLVFLGLFIRNLYITKNETDLSIPVLKDYLTKEITHKELDSFIKENPSSLIYVCSSYNSVCRDFENKIKKIVKKEELGDELIYLNLQEEDESIINKKVKELYDYDLKNYKYPLIISFNDGKIKEVVGSLTKNKFSDYMLEVNK